MKKGIIVASFGTTHEETRKLCIESIENRVRREHKDSMVLRTFTSQIIIDRLKKRENYPIYNLTQALEKMKDQRIHKVYIQPLYILPGKEYKKLAKQAREFSKENTHINVQISKPLLVDHEDFDKVVEGLSFVREKTEEGILFMAHGSDFVTDKSYEVLENRFKEKGHKNIFIATLKGKKTVDHIIPLLKNQDIKKVQLMPFMLVAGRHAIRDMISGENSWKGKLLSAGIKVEESLKGLGEIEGIQDIYMSHLREIICSH
ncbi:MAG: hypothetical protein GX080_03200 [Tissierellia bacterium]|nr:hypothetical protein [Tissierellia bacterium]